MISRRLQHHLTSALAEVPAVALLGPRQSGKTTLALAVAGTRPAIYLDLESEADRAKLSDPEAYLAQHADRLVILDEIQRTPELFRSLRGIIDAAPAGTRPHFFRASAGAEIDLLLDIPGHRQPWAIDIKRGSAPRIEKGFHLACESVDPERFPLAAGIEAVPLGDLCAELSVI